MGRFHFDESTLNGAATTLSSIKNIISNNIIQMNNTLLELYGLDGFNISYAINGLREEINKANNCVQEIETGMHCLNGVIGTVRLYTGNASIVDIANKFIDKTLDKVSSIIIGNESVFINGDNSTNINENTEIKNIHNYYSDLNIKNNGYQTMGFGYDNTNKSFRLFKEDGSDFEHYCQYTQDFDYGEIKGVECTSTALAQCSSINGMYKQAKNYNDYGQTQIGFVNVNKDELYNYCIMNLEQGKATVIYYNYLNTSQETRAGWDGHAVTVIGVSENPYGFTDLLVIDPSDGHTKYLGDCKYQLGTYDTLYGYNGYTNLYIGYELDLRGAATKLNEINQVYPDKKSECK